MATPEYKKPTINISRPHTTNELIDIVLPLLGKREIYTCRRQLVRAVTNKYGRPVTLKLPKQILANEIEDSCTWVKDKGRGGTVRTKPPKALVESIFVLGQWPHIRPWPPKAA
jgi:dihydroorotate dehydrogenase